MVVSLFIKKEIVFIDGLIVDEISTGDYQINWIFSNLPTYADGFLVGMFIYADGVKLKILSNIGVNVSTPDYPFNTLPTNIQILTSEFKRLELFQDEKISVTSSLQNSNDLGKIFTDYSQSFTIPASKNNNEILSHWHESSIDGGYDHRVRYDAYLEIDTHRFKDGNLQLEKASKKNGFVENYTVTFYGNLTQLKDKFKDTKLRDLPTGFDAGYWEAENFWDIFSHPYNSTEVRSRVISGGGSVLYPLIGSSKKYYYKNGIADQDITLTTSPVVWNELFPAVLMTSVFYIIQQYFKITFTGSFFSLQQWTNLYLYLKNAEQLVVNTKISNLIWATKTGTPNFNEFNLTSGILTTNFNFSNISMRSIDVRMQIIPTSLIVPYKLFVFKDGVLFTTFSDLIGVQDVRCDALSYMIDRNSHQYSFSISSNSPITFNSKLFYIQTTINPFSSPSIVKNTKNAYNTAQSTIAEIELSNYVPDITVNDFITGIIKAFNLMIIPTAKDTYEFIPLESYYNEGKTLDITEYVYSEEAEIERPKLYKSINFQYEKSTSILNNKFKGLYNTEYGDLIYTNDNSNESSNYDVKLPFENVLFEKTVGENFLTASIIDKDQKPYIPKPILIYNNGSENLSTPVQFKTETGFNNFSSYQRFSNEHNAIPTDLTYSYLMTMNFSNEQSPWYNVLAPQGLYYRHYKNFIDNLYNIKTRIVKIKAILPTSILGSTVLNNALKPIGIALNDRLVIRNKRYIINNFTTDLTTGESSFELLTDYRGIDAKNSVGYRFASYGRVQVDATAQDVEEVIYLNDYDYFQVKGATTYLSYPTSGLQETADLNLTVSIPFNDTGIDREDVVGIEYYTGGTLQITEYITFLQTA